MTTMAMTRACVVQGIAAVATTTTTMRPATTTEAAGRAEGRTDFAAEEQLTAQLASMADVERAALGYSVNEMVLDCQFAGSTCKPRSGTHRAVFIPLIFYFLHRCKDVFAFFFYFGHFFTFSNVFLYFLQRFFTSVVLASLTPRAARGTRLTKRHTFCAVDHQSQ